MTDDNAGGRDTRLQKPEDRARADKYRFGVEKGQAWVRAGGTRRAAPSELNNLRQFWRTTPEGNMFWFHRTPGWRFRDYLFFKMRPWVVNKLAESAAFWAGLGLEVESEDAAFLTGFVDGALSVAESDRDVG